MCWIFYLTVILSLFGIFLRFLCCILHITYVVVLVFWCLFCIFCFCCWILLFCLRTCFFFYPFLKAFRFVLFLLIFLCFILSLFFVFKYSKVPCFLLILPCCFQVNVLWFIILWKTHKCCSTPNSFNMLGYALSLSVTITSFLNQVIIMDVWDWVLWGRCRLIDLLVNIWWIFL